MVDNAALRERCRYVAGTVLINNGWTLVPSDDQAFVEAVYQHLMERFPERVLSAVEQLDDGITRSAKNVYCRALYAAYRKDGTAQQALAMAEVQRFVYRQLLYMTRGDTMLAEECTQEAIGQAWAKWERVIDPGCFLSYVAQIGVRCVLLTRRKQLRENPADHSESQAGSSRASDEADLGPDQIAETKDLQQRLLKTIEHCLRREDEIRLIVEYFIHGRSFKELAEAWGRPPAYLHVLKFRALAKLQKCEAIQELRADWMNRD